MADIAKRDQNNVPCLLGTSSSDGTPVAIYADPTTHRLYVNTGTSVLATWGVTGNTSTVTDASVVSTSFVQIMNTDIPAGRWKIVCGTGSFVITSSDVENSALTFTYRIL